MMVVDKVFEALVSPRHEKDASDSLADEDDEMSDEEDDEMLNGEDNIDDLMTLDQYQV